MDECSEWKITTYKGLDFGPVSGENCVSICRETDGEGVSANGAGQLFLLKFTGSISGNRYRISTLNFRAVCFSWLYNCLIAIKIVSITWLQCTVHQCDIFACICFSSVEIELIM